MQKDIKAALGNIRNAESDYQTAKDIFDNRDCGAVATIAAARLADDMAAALGSFGTIAESSNFAGARVLASFGAMAAELRRLQDETAELKKAAALADSAERRRVELCAELRAICERLDSAAYDIGELPARLIDGDIPAAASLIRSLPELRQAIADADSVLGDNPDA